jgi:hypothetical protein
MHPRSLATLLQYTCFALPVSVIQSHIIIVDAHRDHATARSCQFHLQRLNLQNKEDKLVSTIIYQDRMNDKITKIILGTL